MRLCKPRRHSPEISPFTVSDLSPTHTHEHTLTVCGNRVNVSLCLLHVAFHFSVYEPVISFLLISCQLLGRPGACSISTKTPKGTSEYTFHACAPDVHVKLAGIKVHFTKAPLQKPGFSTRTAMKESGKRQKCAEKQDPSSEINLISLLYVTMI